MGDLVPAEQAPAKSVKLTELGGTAEVHEVSDEALEAVAAAAPVATQAAAEETPATEAPATPA